MGTHINGTSMQDMVRLENKIIGSLLFFNFTVETTCKVLI